MTAPSTFRSPDCFYSTLNRFRWTVSGDSDPPWPAGFPGVPMFVPPMQPGLVAVSHLIVTPWHGITIHRARSARIKWCNTPSEWLRRFGVGFGKLAGLLGGDAGGVGRLRADRGRGGAEFRRAAAVATVITAA